MSLPMELTRMPTYDYECRKCGHVFEKFHSMTAKPRVRCPECRAVAKKMLGVGAGIIFKGSGFYETDYRRKSGSPPSSETSDSKPKETTKSETGKSETGKSDKTGTSTSTESAD